ncbi:DNA (cytosine-5-)-methyltransferase [Streptomyces sp. COG21]|uniref:DNA cytosine methyltransferase n=1 Tax=Streptomyces sp. COG21 TaxID=2838872 RepID=UPI001EFD1D0A|nr:DNA (cytosine-5-)-methyltransferase [Streptomyces sp. COG21]
MAKLQVAEICAGAGGQALGLERAGFEHAVAVELDPRAAETLKSNMPGCDVRTGDVADRSVWDPEEFCAKHGTPDLIAGGVPCPPFTIAGKQLGAADERDLFAWAVGLAERVRPKALLLENVRGLSANRFAAYRQNVLDTLQDAGYVAQWELFHAADFGVPQLRPRFVLVALQREYAPYFAWPKPLEGERPKVGETLYDLMAARGWKGAEKWAEGANDIAPTIVGGSKKHGGADLGPTRAKAGLGQARGRCSWCGGRSARRGLGACRGEAWAETHGRDGLPHPGMEARGQVGLRREEDQPVPSGRERFPSACG